MEPAQILEMNRPSDPDCCYSTRAIPRKRRRRGRIAAGCLLLALLTGAAVTLSLFEIRFDRTDGGYSVQLQRRGWSGEDSEPEQQPAESEQTRKSDRLSDSVLSINSANGGMSLPEIYEAVRPSVVSVVASGRSQSSGTGVILDEEGYIVTCYHVVDDAASISVLLSDDREFSAVLAGSDQATDLALLKIEAEDLAPADFGSSDSLRVGDTVVAIGDPLGLELRGTMTEGIISGENRRLMMNGVEMELIQTNTALNTGNSGGPLINRYGQVVGINTAKVGSDADLSGAEGLGFAIPSATVERIVSELLTNGYVSGRVSLGITTADLDPWQQAFLNLPQGVYVIDVDPNSDAYAMGVQYGDLLVAVDGKAIASVSDLNTVLMSYAPGEVAALTVYRHGVNLLCTVRLGEQTPT